nr:NP1 [Bocaparvovirus carnivoran2]
MKSSSRASSARQTSHHRSRSRSPRDSRLQSGERCSESSASRWRRNRSSYTASKTSPLSRRPKTTPMEVFNQHRAKTKTDISMCGFYWHSTRLARSGTDWIFNSGKPLFQSKCSNNLVSWDVVREILFEFKKTIDQKYRNMLWHFGRGGYCNKCEYWDNVYLEHLANVDSSNDVVMQEISDAEMLEAAMEIDGASE